MRAFALTREERRFCRISKGWGPLVRDGAPDGASALPGERLLTMRDFLLKKEEHDEHPSRRFAADTARAQRVFYRHGLAGTDHCSGNPGTDPTYPRAHRPGPPTPTAF